MKRPLYILCGGASSRMGEDKALLTINGETFLKRLIKRCSPLFSNIILLIGSTPYDIYVEQLPDEVPGKGPLGALYTALYHCKVDSLAIIPVDMPAVSHRVINHLATGVMPKDRTASIIKDESREHPLTGFYSKECLKTVTRHIHSDDLSLRSLISDLSVHFFEVSSQEVKNINTPEDYEELLGRV